MFIKNKKYLGFLFLYLINFNNLNSSSFNSNIANVKNWVLKHKLATSLACFSVLLVTEKLILHKLFLKPFSKTARYSSAGKLVVAIKTLNPGSKNEKKDYQYSSEQAVQCEHRTKVGKYCDQCGLKIMPPKVIVGWGGSSILNQKRIKG